MFKWLEKIVIKQIIKRVTNELPELNQKALQYWENNKDEIIEKAKDKIKDIILEKVKR